MGRPKLNPEELPQFLFLEDWVGLKQETLLKAKMKQEKLSSRQQHQLDAEIKMLPDLCRLLDSIQTAREFLIMADQIRSDAQSDSDLHIFLVSITL